MISLTLYFSSIVLAFGSMLIPIVYFRARFNFAVESLECYRELNQELRNQNIELERQIILMKSGQSLKENSA